MQLAVQGKIDWDQVPVFMGDPAPGLNQVDMVSIVTTKEQARKEFERFLLATDLPEGV